MADGTERTAAGDTANPSGTHVFRIFLSYRREDSSGHAGRLYDSLRHGSDEAPGFGKEQIFMDVDTIAPGVNFRRVIEEAVSACDVFIAVIGRQWLHAADASGRRRLDDPADFVRLEVEAALAREIPVVPALVQGADMPKAEELPEAFHPFLDRNGVELSDGRWSYDVGRLVAWLKTLEEQARRERVELERLERERLEREAAERAEREQAELAAKLAAEAEQAQGKRAELAEHERAGRGSSPASQEASRIPRGLLGRKRLGLALLGTTIAVTSVVLALVLINRNQGASAEEDVSPLPKVTALPSSSCTDIEYEGEGEPDVLIASDLPLRGSWQTQTLQMAEASRQVLDSVGWKAGAVNVGFQSCDDSTAQAGTWDPGKCRQNAKAYAANPSLLAVLGTFNAGCTALELPILNQAPAGGLAMVSSANTYICLTQGGPGCADDEPDRYYPSGQRNYVRVVPYDVYQGAGLAQLMEDQGTAKLFILNDKEAYGIGLARNVEGAAEFVGIEVVGFEAWNPKASNYEALMQKVSQSGADGLFLGGLFELNGAQVIKDKVKVLGPNDGDVKLYMPDGFATQQTIDEAGVESTRNAYVSVPGVVPPDEFDTEAAQEFITTFQERLGEPVDSYAIYGAQAAQVVLDAIATSDYTRAGVIEQLFATEVEDGLLGDFSFDENGDPTDASGAVASVTIFRGEEQLEVERVISPGEDVVQAARSG